MERFFRNIVDVRIKAQVSEKKNKQSISKEEWKQVTEFADMLAKVAKLLDESADIEDLKKFLMFFCHPYVDPKLYEHCSTPTEIIEAHFPCYIHYMNTCFLMQIVGKKQV